MPDRFPRAEIEQSIPARFARQCAAGADRVAVATRDGGLTYRQLDVWSSAIASRLLARLGAEPGPVPFLLPQGPLAIATTLGILKAGKFYVPLDPAWALARIGDLCAELGAACVPCDAEFAPRLRERLASGSVLELARECPATAEPLPLLDIDPARPAYVYFTSGSTGRPKGVVDCHRNVLHNVMRYTNALAIAASDRLTLLQSCGFSGAVSSMFAALLNGATSLPIDMRRETPARMADWIDAAGATIYHSVPAIFRSLMTPGREFGRLRVVRLEGDRATRRDLELFRAHVRAPCRLAIGLGATETGLVCQYFHDHASPLPDAIVPIGYAVDDMRFDVRDAGGIPVAAGASGEIVVHSRFLALGYWNDAQATARAFGVADAANGERSYRTGDLGRIGDDGRLEYLGRLDGRARIRGEWVALADVDAALAALPGVREAVAATLDDARGNARLVAWFVADPTAPPGVAALRRGLAARLPPHMLPARYVALDALPLNDNGKVDRAALPPPGQARPPLEAPFVPPADLVQLRLCELWERCLDVQPIGIDDDFFALGGDSLLAATMLDEAESLFESRLPPTALLAGPTVAALARVIARGRRDLEAPVVALRSTGTRPPFFFLHGDYHSGGFYCLELARHLAPSQPFYALPPCGYDGRPIPPSYAAAAALHVEAIRGVQPHGPYYLGGQCNGGLVALEIARLLEARGERVASLVLLGASARNVRFRRLAALVETAGRIGGLSARARGYAFGRLRDFALHQEGLPVTKRLRFALGKLGVLRSEARRVARTRGDDADAMLDAGAPALDGRREHIFESYLQLDRGYVPGRFRGRASVLWPREDASPAHVEARSWSRVVGSLDLIEIPGDHNSCLTRHVRDLAAAIQRVLDRDQRDVVGLPG
ncbi:MAG TPA: AMP-binding protein [Casimicrobiaceae bacterium]